MTEELLTDPSQNFMERLPRPLDAIFLPKTVAVIGAKDELGTVGRTILSNLLNPHFKGKVYPVNPKRSTVLGLKSYPTIGDVPEEVDLAIIVTPAHTVPGIVKECVQAKVKSLIIISAGFKELGPQGLALENEILKYTASANVPIIGPNCLGVMNPIYGLNATFAKGMALPGNMAFISQSGAMCTAVLDWSFQERIGFSSFVSIGSMADVDWGDLIDYLGGDPQTHCILIYMETIGDPRSFMSAAREIALEKPIIVIKAGRSTQAAHAAASHTGSLAGSDEVFDAALERVGVLRVKTISELFQIASVLSRQPRPKGPHLSIITNAGGPAVLATDATVLNGAQLAKLSSSTIEKLNQELPNAWSHGNPIDILGDAGPERYAKTLEEVAKDPLSDGILVILSPQDVTDPTTTAECLVPLANIGKPVLASWMGGATVSKGIEVLTYANIPTFSYPDDAAATFALMWSYSHHLNALYEIPVLHENEEPEQAAQMQKKASTIIQKALNEKRELLDEYESKQLLAAYGIPTVETQIAKTVDEAVHIANQLSYPVVLKLFSKTITHKTDVGGVKLNLKNKEEVISAFESIQKGVKESVGLHHFEGVTVQKMIKLEGYELIIGASIDPQFGPVILFGSGGQLVEVYKDSALAFPPLNSSLARNLMEKTKVFEALKGVRGRKGIQIELLEKILVKFSLMIAENPRIKECDINPLLASPEGIIALDARVVLHSLDIPDEKLPKLAIRPYPSEYIKTIQLKNGLQVTLRPILPEDEPLAVAFHRELSEHSVRQRYFEFLSLDERVAHERLVRICFNDFDREIATVAEIKQGSNHQIIGIARLSIIPGTRFAKLTMMIADAYHRLGLGHNFLSHLLQIAEQEKLQKITAVILSENEGMITLCKQFGFKLTKSPDGKFTYAEKICT